MLNETKHKRLLSIDALRGFDMLFIMGGAAFFINLADLFPCVFTQMLAEQMKHVEWDGLTHHDTIFPLFLFIAGISFPFSLEKQRDNGRTDVQIYSKIIRRGLMLVLLGCIFNDLLDFNFAEQRYASVLGRIGLAWMFAAMIFTKTKPATRIIITIAILVGYWLLLLLVPVPDAGGAGSFSKEGSLVGYIDRNLLPGRLIYAHLHDPEGLLSTLPAIGTALLGMFAGEFVKSEHKGLSEIKKVGAMSVVGVFLLVIGLVWNQVFPINKNLWSSSFVCVVGAYSILMFALFYLIIDVLNFRRWTFFFAVIGMNSITIYLGQKFINFSYTNKAILGGIINHMPEAMQPITETIGYIAVCWVFLYFLYRQKIFLKV